MAAVRRLQLAAHAADILCEILLAERRIITVGLSAGLNVAWARNLLMSGSSAEVQVAGRKF